MSYSFWHRCVALSVQKHSYFLEELFGRAPLSARRLACTAIHDAPLFILCVLVVSSLTN
jgi:hypothetical protein